MVKITNNIDTFEVTKGAYESVFKAQGFTRIDEPSSISKDEGGTAAMNEEQQLLSDLEEKPISQWTKDEVKHYASAKGISLAGTRSIEDAKERIKAYMA